MNREAVVASEPLYFNFHDVVTVEVTAAEPEDRAFFAAEYNHHRSDRATPERPGVILRVRRGFGRAGLSLPGLSLPDTPAGRNRCASHAVGGTIDYFTIKQLEPGKQTLEQCHSDDKVLVKLVKPVFPVEQGIERFEQAANLFRR